MPMYEYKCSKGHVTEDLRKLAERRHHGTCNLCGSETTFIISTPRIDPNADLPGARMTQRRKMEERGRGRDMTSANKTVADESIAREAHEQRAARGENPIISS